jgi:hypothetical protein
MQYYFSPSTLGFYVDVVHGDDKPADCVPISEELWYRVGSGQSIWRMLVAGEDGMPHLARRVKRYDWERMTRHPDPQGDEGLYTGKIVNDRPPWPELPRPPVFVPTPKPAEEN